MKKLILTLLLIIHLPGLAQDSRPWPKVIVNHPNPHIRVLLMKELTKAGLYGKKVVVYKLPNNYPVEAFVEGSAGGDYKMYLKKDIELIHEIIPHEVVHILQVERGDLEVLRDGFMWEGDFYPSSTKYHNRPWEDEAYSKTNKR